MMFAADTSKATATHSVILERLAIRWRAVGLHLAAMDRTGMVSWIDDQTPPILKEALGDEEVIRSTIAGIDDLRPEQRSKDLTVTGFTILMTPVIRRRKLVGWIAAVARTGNPTALNESIARFAMMNSTDAQLLASKLQKLPLVPKPQLSQFGKLVAEMYDDLFGSTSASAELSSVTEQLTTVYEEISLLYKISSGMRFNQKPQSFLENVCREVQEIGNFRAVCVVLKPTSEGAENSDVGASDAIKVLVGECPFSMEELIRSLQEPIYDALNLGETQVHNEIVSESDWSWMSSEIDRLVCVPLEREKRSLGVVIALDKKDKTEFNSVDLKLLNNVGNQCSIFLENAALYADMQGLFMGVLHALTHSIDAKDAYTRGHSQRVAALSRDLARKAGLSDEQCERVYLSGLLHDVGKIGVPESVLAKPGRLTDAEFDAIKKHPDIGAQILGNIKQLQDIIPGVLCHHERYDGLGYPSRIAGEAIPLIGRIICIADSFDAMSSTRTYRPALPLDTVLSEIKRCAGKQFDPTLAEAFVTLDFSAYQTSIEMYAKSIKPNAEFATPTEAA